MFFLFHIIINGLSKVFSWFYEYLHILLQNKLLLNTNIIVSKVLRWLSTYLDCKYSSLKSFFQNLHFYEWIVSIVQQTFWQKATFKYVLWQVICSHCCTLKMDLNLSQETIDQFLFYQKVIYHDVILIQNFEEFW